MDVSVAQLVTIVAEALGVEAIDPGRSLASHGADSLSVVELQSALRMRLGKEVPLGALVERCSLERLAEVVAASPDVTSAPASRGGQKLNLGQRALLLDEELEGGSTAYHIALSLRLDRTFDASAIERGLRQVIAHHPLLRATLDESEPDPRWRVHAEPLRGWWRVEHAREVEARIGEIAQERFDLRREGPLRAVLLEGPAAVLVLVLHPVGSDLWSLALLLQQLDEAIAAERDGATVAWLPYTVDLGQQQAEALASPAGRAQLDAWAERLRGELPELALPGDRPRSKGALGPSATLRFALGDDLVSAARSVARGHDASLAAVLLAVYAALLARMSGQREVVIGVPTIDRGHPERAGFVGYLVNTLPLRVEVDLSQSFGALVDHVRDRLVELVAWQATPLAAIVERLTKRGMGAPFQTSFTFQRVPHAFSNVIAQLAAGREAELDLGGVRVRATLVDVRPAQLDTAFAFVEVDSKLLGSLEYATARFDPRTAEGLLERWMRLAEAFFAHPESPVGRAPLLAADELRVLRDEWNATAQPEPRARCVHQWFDEQASRAPDAIALIDGATSVTYAELDRRSNQLAHRLRMLGVGPDVLVGICMTRSPDAVVGLLGILKAGGAYVPLDPVYPADRLAFMVADSGVRVLLTRRDMRDSVPQTDAQVVCLDDEAGEAGVPETRPTPLATTDHLAYVIYTSGSTGTPKGVMVTHRGVVNIIASLIRTHACDERDRTLQQTSMSFDVSVNEIFAPLCCGGAIVFSTGVLDVDRMLALVAQHRITMVMAVPSVLSRINAEKDTLPSLRVLFSGGEELALSHIDKLIEAGPIINGYGPTETTIAATAFDLRTYEPRPGHGIPIGKPLDNYRVYILDAERCLVPVGVQGELYIAGVGVARGYLHRPDLTAEKFVPSPFGDGERLYRTGDVGVWLPDGNIVFKGRVDHQVKIRGFRIELGEIEARLSAHPGVREGVVVAQDDERGQKRLVAYLVAARDTAPATSELRAHVAETLPDHMVPSLFVALDSLPRTANDKVDRNALPAVGLETTEYVAPRDELERAVADVWRDVMKVERVGAHDDFFALGGHSLLAMTVVARLRRELGKELVVRDLFEAASVGELARRIASRGGAPTLPPLVVEDRSGDIPLASVWEPFFGQDQGARWSLLFNLTSLLRMRGPLDAALLERAFTLLVERHEALRMSFHRRDGVAFARVHPAKPFQLPTVDLALDEGPAQQHAIESQVLAIASEPFDLTQPPLLRATLIGAGSGCHFLVMAIHHVVSDGWAVRILQREVIELYSALTLHGNAAKPALPIQPGDFALWQRRMTEAIGEADRAYWCEALRDAPRELALPFDRPPGDVTGDAAMLRVKLERDLALDVLRATRSFFALTWGAAALAMHLVTGALDIVIGTVHANRTHADLMDVIGCFVNFVALRARLDEAENLEALLERFDHETLEALTRARYPFGDVVDAVGVARRPGRNPLYNVFFRVDEPFEAARDERLGLEVQPLPPPLPTEELRVDLGIVVARTAHSIDVGFQYKASRFDPETVATIAERYQEALAALVRGGKRSVAELRARA